MKIALFSSVFPPAISGPAKHTYDLARTLKEKGVDAFVITFGDKNFDKNVGETKVYYLKKYDSGLRFFTLFFKYINAYIRVNSILKEEAPDIVHHMSGGDYLSLISGIVSKRKKIPSIVKFAGDLTWERTVKNLKNLPKYEDIPSFNIKARFLKILQRNILNNFDNIIATSPSQMKSLIDVYRISSRKLVRLPNFINLKDYEKETPRERIDSKIKVINVSRFARWKRIDLCIQVFSLINHRNIVLKIVGGGNPSLEKELRNLCKELGIEDRVEFAGEVNPVEIHSHFLDADIFFSTTAFEPFGIVFIEAMAAGIPIVAPRIGGIPDVVSNGAGFLVEPHDEEDMVKKLELLIKVKKLRDLMGKAGKKRAKDFDLAIKIDDMFGLYRNLITKQEVRSNDLSCSS